MNQAYKYTWVASILLFPIFGGIFYLFYNSRNYSKKQRNFYNKITARMKDELKERNLPSDNLIINYLSGRGWANYKNTNVEFFHTGKKFLPKLLKI